MEKTLGVSIYPDKSSYEETTAYLDLAAKYEVKKVFASLLQVAGDAQEVMRDFKKIIDYATNLGMEFILDVNPFLLPALGASWKDLSFFNELGVKVLRLDGGYSGLEEMMMSHNTYGIKIELNMSAGLEYIHRIMSFSPNKKQVSASYNFYPHRHTGMVLADVKKTTETYHRYHLPTTIFITSQAAEVGPWKLQEGLCTLEEHRELSLSEQIKHILLLDLADNLIIGNCFASEAELAAASTALKASTLLLDMEVTRPLSEAEMTILNSDFHFVRPEYSEFMIRSAFSRHLHKEAKIPPVAFDGELKAGDIIIDNSNYGQYESELQILLQDMPNTSKLNKIGSLRLDNFHLLGELSRKPYQKFKFNYQLVGDEK